MVDELQLLREVFKSEEEPGAGAWELMHGRLAIAIDTEQRLSGQVSYRVRTALGSRRRVVSAMAAAAALIVGLVVSLNGSGTQSVASASPFRLVSLVTVQAFRASPEAVQFANHVTCPTSTDCYLVARFMNAPTASAGNNVYSSTDGGSTWRELALPSGTYVETALSCTSSVHCSAGGSQYEGLNANDKPIMNPVFLSTSNGGESWTVQPFPTPQLGQFQLLLNTFVTQLSCPSSETCEALLVANFGGPGYSTANDNVFMRTDDGGQSWSTTILPGQPAPRSGGGLFVNSPMNDGMSCPSTQVCVASALLSPIGGATSIVWRTDDGGATWLVGSLPDGLTSAGPLSCPDSLHCWIVAGSYGKGSNSQLLESIDGGASWNVRSPQGLPGTTMWGSVSCPTNNNCWLAGEVTGANRESVVYASNDGGQTWTNVLLPSAIGAESAPLHSIDEVDCNTTLTCVVLGSPAGVSEAGVNEAILTNAVPTS
jgi:photosystem II stability/assembly factor-like uncharacterized protein